MSRQYFAEVLAPIMTADQTAVTGTSETALWPVSPYTATVANQLQPGQVYRIFATGVLTSALSSPGTLTITPRWGTTSSGTSLGISAASATLTTSKTNVPWWMECLTICRTLGTSGTMVFNGNFVCDQVGISALAFGGPSTTIDTTTAQGFYLGVTLGSASDSMTTRLVTVEAIN